MFDSVLVWFRRDLRVTDHAALSAALQRAGRVYCAFIFDPEILEPLDHPADRRVEFIRLSLLELDAALRARGGALIVRHARAVVEIPRLAKELAVAAVFVNRDYEPFAKRRDGAVASALQRAGVLFQSFKDQVIFEGGEVSTQEGRPYTVFTPYKRAWQKRLRADDWRCHEASFGSLHITPLAKGVPDLTDIGFVTSNLGSLCIPVGMSGAQVLLGDFLGRMSRYRELRDFPAKRGVSYLSAHLRFGTVSIREVVSTAIACGALHDADGGAATWLSELIWRDFFFMILDSFPEVVERSFRTEYDAIVWDRGAQADDFFAAWCVGRTGYPLVDAAMRQLNETGYMHNRLRMLSASFLSKDLGIDWRRGEAYFARQLNDFDLAANNGGWQWAASSGCDAQPYFRIFNPVRQSERFDPEGKFIRRYLPELATVPVAFIHEPWRMSALEQSACGVTMGKDTPEPIVDHAQARRRTLLRFAVVKRVAAP